MAEFEALLPHISSRVAEVGVAGRMGPFARFDNDVYFHIFVISLIDIPGESLRFAFYRFFNLDGSCAKPAIETLGDLLTIRVGYDETFPGSIVGSRAIRNELRHFRETQGWGKPSLVVMRIKPSQPMPPFAPRCWTAVSVAVAQSRFKGKATYDWAELGRNVTDSLGPVLRVLELVRPSEEEMAFRSR